MAQLVFEDSPLVSEKGGREGNRFQGTSEAEKEAREVISHEVQDEISFHTDTSEGGEDAAQKCTTIVKAPDSAHDAPRCCTWRRWTASGVETYAIQCNLCFKWRVVPSKERYEAIGEHILEEPFVCVNAQEWRTNASCDDTADLKDNEPTVLWAIDKHNIPRSPKGFYRKVVLRAENAKKFADIYYKTPCGKILRSMVQVQRYLNEHPELGVKISQFSFTSPKGRNDDMQSRGSCIERLLRNETQSRKKLNGNPKMKTAGHDRPPRPQPPIGKGPHVKSNKLSSLKLNAVRQDNPIVERLGGSKAGPHPMAVKTDNFEVDSGSR